LLVDGPHVSRACSVMQVHVLVALQARFRLQGDLPVRLVAVEAWLVGMHDDGLVVALSIIVAIQALARLAEEHVGRTDAETQRSDAESSRVLVGRVFRSFALEDVTTRAVARGALGSMMQAHIGMAGVAGVDSGHFEVPLSNSVTVLTAHAARHVSDMARALTREAPTRANFGRAGGLRRAAACRECRREDAEQEHEAFEPSARKRACALHAGVPASEWFPSEWFHGRPRIGHQAGVLVSNGVA
jgi:hypothetical protein